MASCVNLLRLCVVAVVVANCTNSPRKSQHRTRMGVGWSIGCTNAGGSMTVQNLLQGHCVRQAALAKQKEITYFV